MAVDEILDNPKTRGWRGFAREAWAESAKNLRFRQGYNRPKDNAHVSATQTKMQKINNAFFTIQAASMSTLGLCVAFMGYDIYETRNAINDFVVAPTEVIEDASAANGVVGNRDVVALRQGDEFVLFSHAESSRNDSRYRYIADAAEAETTAQTQIAHYEALITILAAEEAHGIDLQFNNNSQAIDFGYMSNPYLMGDRTTPSIYFKDNQRSDTVMDQAALESTLSDWQAIHASIEDGGYGIQETSIMIDRTIETDFPVHEVIAETIAKGFASYLSLAFLGGAGIAGFKRSFPSSPKKSASSSAHKASRRRKSHDTDHAGPM